MVFIPIRQLRQTALAYVVVQQVTVLVRIICKKSLDHGLKLYDNTNWHTVKSTSMSCRAVLPVVQERRA